MSRDPTRPAARSAPAVTPNTAKKYRCTAGRAAGASALCGAGLASSIGAEFRHPVQCSSSSREARRCFNAARGPAASAFGSYPSRAPCVGCMLFLSARRSDMCRLRQRGAGCHRQLPGQPPFHPPALKRLFAARFDCACIEPLLWPTSCSLMARCVASLTAPLLPCACTPSLPLASRSSQPTLAPTCWQALGSAGPSEAPPRAGSGAGVASVPAEGSAGNPRPPRHRQRHSPASLYPPPALHPDSALPLPHPRGPSTRRCGRPRPALGTSRCWTACGHPSTKPSSSRTATCTGRPRHRSVPLITPALLYWRFEDCLLAEGAHPQRPRPAPGPQLQERPGERPVWGEGLRLVLQLLLLQPVSHCEREGRGRGRPHAPAFNCCHGGPRSTGGRATQLCGCFLLPAHVQVAAAGLLSRDS